MKTKVEVRSFPVYGVGIRDLVWTGALTLLAIIVPALLAHTPHNQWITGTIVNALLFIAAWRLGVGNAFLVAALPSSIALMRGLLPSPMALLVPYIILSNILLVVVFAMLKKHLLIGIAASSATKFLFLFSLSVLFASKLSAPFLIMLQWPQLATALAGGALAFGAVSLLKKSA